MTIVSTFIGKRKYFRWSTKPISQGDETDLYQNIFLFCFHLLTKSFDFRRKITQRLEISVKKSSLQIQEFVQHKQQRINEKYGGFYNYSKHFFHQNGTYIKYFHYLCRKNQKERNHSSWNNLKEYHTEYLISSILSSETSIMSIRLCICLCWKKRQTLSSLYVLEDSARVC